MLANLPKSFDFVVFADISEPNGELDLQIVPLKLANFYIWKI